MEKLNIAELLLTCKKGMELDCALYEDVYFDYVDELDIIHCYIQHETYKTAITFNQYGTYNSDIKSKCVIFPKGKTTWEGFVPPCHFKDGDILFVDCSDGEDKGYQYIFILNKPEFYGKWHSYCHLDGVGDFHSIATYLAYDEDHPRFATEEEKEKLFKVIKDNGYRWNEETKTLEKLIKQEFKDGDVVVSSLGHIHILKNRSTSYIFVDFVHNSNGSLCKSLTTGVRVDRLATEEEKEKLFKVIKDNGYRWNEETKNLEKLVEHRFKVGDRIRSKKDAPINISNVLITKVNEYSYEGVIGDTTNPAHINFKYQDLYELVPIEPKFKVGDRIQSKKFIEERTIKICEEDGYRTTAGTWIRISDQDDWELAPNKFDITSLKTFDQVLVRDFDNTPWEIEFFSRLLDGKHFKCSGLSYMQCIPYKGNEHLNGKKDDCDKYFKTWE